VHCICSATDGTSQGQATGRSELLLVSVGPGREEEDLQASVFLSLSGSDWSKARKRLLGIIPVLGAADPCA